ncbi:MAG: uracil-DNA glycosylase [Kiritimatiellae bacterium]|nr:uracil-DNA glycosylase [Kiritimatiellia bacterium]
MNVPRDILADLRTHLEVEIQAGRRRAPIDPAVAQDFLLGVAPAAPAPAPTRPAAPPAPPAPAPAASASTPSALAAAAPDLAAVAAAVAGCGACALAATRTKAVPGEGNGTGPDVMFVGEAPGADEDLQGRPFVGRAGQLLDKMIAAMGYARADVFIANILKCRPPGNRTPTPDEMSVCIPFLKRQIALVRPKAIVALGATAWRGLSGDPGASISRVRGIWQSFEGIPVMPTFHPAYLLRCPSAKRTAWEDLKLVLARLGRGT